MSSSRLGQGSLAVLEQGYLGSQGRMWHSWLGECVHGQREPGRFRCPDPYTPPCLVPISMNENYLSR